jgi:hypothetical protein
MAVPAMVISFRCRSIIGKFSRIPVEGGGE